MQRALKRTYLNLTLGVEMMKHIINSKKYPWWNVVLPNLVLGAIPIKEWKHIDKLKELGITHVVTVTEKHENHEANLLVTPVSPEDWARHDVVHKQVETPDMSGLSLRQIRETVKYIDEVLRDPHNKVYIHCKAGKGRSVIMTACYLIYTKDEKPDEVVDGLQKIRRVVHLNSQQSKCIEEYYQELVDFQRS